MKDLVHIRKTDISVKEHKGQLVAIFRNIDTVYMIDQTEQREEALNKRKEFYTCSPLYFPPWRSKGRLWRNSYKRKYFTATY